jgi:basic membrane lipoprotein Med (substrate-binding protein (PBP1-ABC) superfamily)
MVGLVAVVVGLSAWLVCPAGPSVPRTRQYLEFTACLLTDGQGVAGAVAASVWAGMQDASVTTRAKVQYLAVVGEASAANARPYLASLVQRRCGVLLAAGSAQVAAVAVDAPRYPSARFITVGGGPSAANVTVVDATASTALRQRVAALVIAAVGASGGR